MRGVRWSVRWFVVGLSGLVLWVLLALSAATSGSWPSTPGAAAAGAIRVAVEQGPSSSGSATQLAAQLNDDTFFDFTATVVDASQIDTLAELLNYDVVVFGDSGSDDNDWTVAMATALLDWAQNHRGGVVSVGWADFATGSDAARDPILDDVMPIDAYPDTQNIFCGGPGVTIQILSSAHPVTAGLSDFTLPTSGDVEISPLGPDASNGLLLGTASGSCQNATANSIVVGEVGTGRLVYLGPVYLGNASVYSNGDLRTGSADRLLEQAVAWAALGTPPTPTPTATATRTATVSPTMEPTERRNVGGAVGAVAAAAAQQARDNRAAVAGATQFPSSPQVSAPSTGTGTSIAPPNTGDAGLASNSRRSATSLVVLAAIGLVLSVVGLKKRRRYL